MNKSTRYWHCGFVGLFGAALLAGCGRKTQADRLMRKADQDFANAHFDHAESEYRAALQAGAGEEPVARQLGLICQTEGRALQAHALLRRAAQLAPNDVKAQAGLAASSIQVGLLEEARAAAKAALALDPKNETALVALVDSVMTKRDGAETAALLAALRRANGDTPGYELAEGIELLAAGDRGGAERAFRRATALDPHFDSAYAELGNLYALRGDAAASAEAFRQAANLSPWASASRLREVDTLLALGRTDEAEHTLAAIERHAPDYLPALAYSLKLALASRHYAQADALATHILAREATNYDAVIARGTIALGRNDPQAAVSALTLADHLYPKSAQVKYELGLACLGAGDAAQGEERLREAKALAPDYPPPVLALADLNLQQGRPQTVIAELSDFLSRQPRVGRAYLLLAKAYTAEKLPEQALATYRRLGALYPKDPEVPYSAATVYWNENRPGDARRALQSALDINPNFAPAEDLMVSIDLRDGRSEDAARLARQLLAANPKSAQAWFLLGRVDLVRQDRNGAEKSLLKAVGLAPADQAPSLELARLYWSTGRPQQAIKVLNTFAAKNANPVVLMELGILHMSVGADRAAEADYLKLLKIDSKFGAALNNLAYLYSEKLNDPDRAYEFGQRARAADPEGADAADTLGWILYKRGDAREALDLVQESVRKVPGNAISQFHLGAILYRLGKDDAARAALQQALNAGLDPVSAREARQQLAILAIDPAAANSGDRRVLADRVAQQPTDAAALRRLAVIELAAGDFTSAAARYSAALAQTPHEPHLLLALAKIYLGPMHQPARAEDLAKEAHALVPDDAEISAVLGRAALRSGDYRWARDLLGPEDGMTAAKEILADDPRDGPALMLAGLAREDAGDALGAASYYERAHAADPSLVPAAQRLADIYRDAGISRYKEGRLDQAADFLEHSASNDPGNSETEFYLGMTDLLRRHRTDAKTELQRALGLNLTGRHAAEARAALRSLGS